MNIRSTAKAIVLDKNKILLNRCYDSKNGDYYSLPGGGQQQYETLIDAIIRECKEETGYSVIPTRFVALFEEICDNQILRERYPEYSHKIYHIFLCKLCDETREIPTEQDSFQITCEWVDIDSVKDINLLPKIVGDNIKKIIDGTYYAFLGSEHLNFNHG